LSDVFAPEDGFRVRILDLSGASEDNIVEEIKGFPTLMHANAFARAYVRDSVELCRVPGASTREILSSWFAFGEDAEVVPTSETGAGDQGWRSVNELDDFAAHPASEIERDWRAIDPRRDEDGALIARIDDDDDSDGGLPH
jgi:hypothetical protein